MERNQELRDDWLQKLAGWETSQLLFLDESTANERTGDRKYDWAPIGATSVLYRSIKRSKRWSILPVYSSNGMLVWEIIQGSFNQELFLQFVENEVLPLCSPFPGPRSILVMDNAKIHHCDVHSSFLNDYLMCLICLETSSVLR